MSETWGEGGFTLLEIVAVLAIVAMLAAIALPRIPRGTSRAALESYALQAAALLKSDRNAAVRSGTVVETRMNAEMRTISSGGTGRVVQLPNDVGFNAIFADQCGGRPSSGSIEFLPSGMSCGGTIFLSRHGSGFEVRVTWLTGGVEVVPASGL